MALKNYYIILGISPNTSAEGIRGAFRQLAKKFHPDKAGGEKTAFFQDITEAYEVLSDPEKRKLYNQKLTSETKRFQDIPVRQAPEPFKRKEKDLSSKQKYQPHRKHESPINNKDKNRPENVYQRHGWSEFNRNILEMDAFLTPQEAFSGCTVDLTLSFPVQCMACAGTGRDFVFNCIRCGGRGYRIMKVPVEIDLPSRLTDGDNIKTTVALSQENYLHLLIHVYII